MASRSSRLMGVIRMDTRTLSCPSAVPGTAEDLVSALKIAQGRLLSETLGSHCLYLIDDLPAELDPENRAKVFYALLSLDTQLFVSCVELESLYTASSHALFEALGDAEKAQFHVEHGRIRT